MPSLTGEALSRSPIIACNLDADQVERLRAHASSPVVLSYADHAPVWELPQEADILFTFFRGWADAPKEKPEGWPYNLKWIQIASAGIDAFPDWVFEAPLVTTGRGIAAEAIAEYIVMAIFAHEKQVFEGLLVHSRNQWTKRTLGLVSGKSVGFYGFGAIAQCAAQKLAALGMEIGAVRRSGPQGGDGNVRFYPSLGELVGEVDHLVLAVPLTGETRSSVNADIFDAGRPGLHVVNICRGEVLDDKALLAALDKGQVSAATLDVTSPEPLPSDHAFYTHPRIRLTPHISWTSEDNVSRIAAKLHDNLDRFLTGTALADVVVNGRGY